MKAVPLAPLLRVRMGQNQKQTYSVLLADDSAHDRLLMRLALRQHPGMQLVGEVGDGMEVIGYLTGDDKFKDREKYPFPDLLILDLKMPRKTGYEILEWLQSQSYDRLFVAVLSGSTLLEDRHRSMALGANAFYVKAASRQDREAMVCNLGDLLKKLWQRKAQQT